MPGVFISYRREDCPGHAGRLFDRLRARFGTDSVFIDVAGIEAGVDFVDALEKAVGSCDVLLAIIGREWVTSADRKGRRRLDDPGDFLRLEILTALKRNVRVIPVLVEDAPMPSAEVLPDDLAPLTRRQAVELRDTRWDADVEALIALLAKLRQDGYSSTPPRPPDVRMPAPPAPNESMRAPADRFERTPIPPNRSTSPQTARWSIGAVLLLALAVVAAGLAPKYVPKLLGISSSGQARAAQARRPPAVPDVVDRARADAQRASATVPPAPTTPEATVPARESVTVPRVVGQKLERGSTVLRQAGLSVETTVTSTARGVAAWEIVSQTPSPGARVEPGTRVRLVYARPMRTLPNVVGDSLEDAVATLKASGFEPQTRPRSTNDAALQQVLSQVPPGGSDQEQGAVVVLEYAVAAKITVPNVVGLDLTSAQKTIRSAGLIVRPRSETNSTAPAYQVVRQDPAAGSEVDKNTGIALFYAWDPSAADPSRR